MKFTDTLLTKFDDALKEKNVKIPEMEEYNTLTANIKIEKDQILHHKSQLNLLVPNFKLLDKKKDKKKYTLMIHMKNQLKI